MARSTLVAKNTPQTAVQTTNSGMPGVPATGVAQVYDAVNSEKVLKAAGIPKITLDIPENATLDQMIQSLGITIGGYRQLGMVMDQIKPIIGRQLIYVKDTELWQTGVDKATGLKFRNFTEFLEAVIVRDFGYGRSTAFESMKLATKHNTLTADEYTRYGASKLQRVAQIMTRQKLTSASPEYRPLLESARVKTVAQLDEEIRTTNGTIRLNEDGVAEVSVTIRMTKPVKDRWAALCETAKLTSSEMFMELLSSYEEAHVKPVAPAARTPRAPRRATPATSTPTAA